MNIFDILGPIMVGPSSSHTAGAVKIGLAARTLLGEEPKTGEIYFHGSFAATGRGHGTDRALVAGLLSMEPDNMDIPRSFEVAKEKGFTFTIEEKVLKDAHPNTAVVSLVGVNGATIKMQASSLGGGRVMINKIDGIAVDFTGEYNTLIIHNEDKPGLVGKVSTIISWEYINIANMRLYRGKRGGHAVMVIETDQDIPKSVLSQFREMNGIVKVTYFDKED